MTEKRKRDFTKTGAIVAYADYLRKESDALAVIVMRPEDGALSVHDSVAARDVEAMMLAHLEPLVADLQKARDEKRGKGARVKWEEIGGR